MSFRVLCAALALLLAAPGCPGPPPRPPRIVPPVAAPGARLELPQVERFVLPGGLTVLLLPDDRLPLVRAHLMLRAGSIDDPPDRAGLAELTLKMLRRGTRGRTADQISEAFGMHLNEVSKYLGKLVRTGRIRTEYRDTEVYYLAGDTDGDDNDP